MRRLKRARNSGCSLLLGSCLLFLFRYVFLWSHNRHSFAASAAAIRRCGSSLDGAKIVLAHELTPHDDMGGNIRVHRLLSVLNRCGTTVDVYVRDEGTKTKVLKLADGGSVKVFRDSNQMENLLKNLHHYDLIVSTLWFWRSLYDPGIRSIPTLLSESIRRDPVLMTKEHWVITDDIHYVRCMRTEEPHASCLRYKNSEVRVWEDPTMHTVFIAHEDREAAIASSHAAGEISSVVPYLIDSKKSLKSWIGLKRKACVLTYLGSAHPANVKSVQALVYAAEEVFLNFDTVGCELVVVGDEKWKTIFSSWDTSNLHDLGISLRVEGHVMDTATILRDTTLAILPIVVGGTGVSSKVLTCVETGTPFLATGDGMRGFECDEECKTLFFRDSVRELLVDALALAKDATFQKRAKSKLDEIRETHLMHSVAAFTKLISRYSKSSNVNLPQSRTTVCTTCLEIDLCEKVCSSSVDSPLPAVVSAFLSIKGTANEIRFLDGYVRDVVEQDFHEPWELVVGSDKVNTLKTFLQSFLKQPKVPSNISLKLVLLRGDPGLYETWDYLVKQHTVGNFITNWNIDDRKHESSLTIKHSILSQTRANVKLVSSAVRVSHTPNESWDEIESRGGLNVETWFTASEGYYGLLDMAQTKKAVKGFSLKRSSFEHVTSQNLPHNSPMYKRSLHLTYGYFSDQWQKPPLDARVAPTCSDYRLWTLPLSAGELYFHINSPLEVYFLRLDSHNRLSGAKESEECVRQTIQNVLLPEQCEGLGSFSKRLVDVLFVVGANAFNSQQGLRGSELNPAILRLLHGGFRVHVTYASCTARDEARGPPGMRTSCLTEDSLSARGLFDFALIIGEVFVHQLSSKGYLFSHQTAYKVETSMHMESVLSKIEETRSVP